MSGEHARLAPSSGGQWHWCAGSVPMREQYPDKDSEDAREGNAVHWVMSSVLDSYRQPGDIITPLSMVGSTAPNGVIITEEMALNAQVITRLVLEHCNVYGGLSELLVEHRVSCEAVHPTDCWGTLDVGLYVPKYKILNLWDLKYGYKIIEPEDYIQFILYLIGLIAQYPDALTFNITVVQPRAPHPVGPIRSWAGAVTDIRGWVNQLECSAAKALAPDPDCKSGTHCYECSALANCGAARLAALAGIDYTLKALPEEITPDGVGRELDILTRALEAIKYRKKSLETLGTEMTRDKKIVTGWGLETTYGHTKWNKPISAVVAMGELCGLSLGKEAAKTPKQAITAGVPKEIVDAFSETPTTGVKLVREETQLAHIRQELNK